MRYFVRHLQLAVRRVVVQRAKFSLPNRRISKVVLRHTLFATILVWEKIRKRIISRLNVRLIQVILLELKVLHLVYRRVKLALTYKSRWRLLN